METVQYETSLVDAPTFAGALIGAGVMFCITAYKEEEVEFTVSAENEALADKAWEDC